MRILGPTLLAVAFLLAGCSAPDEAATAGPATGLSMREAAEAAAQEMDSSAQLIAVVGLEWTNASITEQFAEEAPEAAAMMQSRDSAVGDGEAPVWGYLFDGETPLLIALSQDGSVVATESIPQDTGTIASYGAGKPLGEVALDSDDAAAIVRAENPDFAALAQGEDSVVIMALAEAPGQGPFWIVTGFEGDMDDAFVLAMVDADDGTYTDFAGLANLFG